MSTSISLSPALYARIIQVLDSGDMDSRKSLKDELLKIVEKQNSNQNDEIKSQAIQVKDCLTPHNATDDSSEDTAYYELVDRHLKELTAKYNAKRKSREEPSLKKKSEGFEEYTRAKQARQDIGDEIVADRKEVHQFDYMSPKPLYPCMWESCLKI